MELPSTDFSETINAINNSKPLIAFIYFLEGVNRPFAIFQIVSNRELNVKDRFKTS